MKKLSTLAFIAIFAVSCSSFDKYKTPETPNGGVAEGEKSSYLLNKPEDSKPAEKTTKTATKKKTSTKKKTK